MIPKFFDAHTHLNMIGVGRPDLSGPGWLEIGERTIKDGTWFVNVGADEGSSQLALEQAKALGSGVWVSVGIHPTEGTESSFEVIKELAQDDKVVAIGECGLEYFQIADEAVRLKQRELFIKHIELALGLDKPLMIHCRASVEDKMDAYNDTYDILKSYKNQVGDKLRFNMHFFTSDWSIAQKFLDLGGCLSFSGVVTFSQVANETIKNAPLGRIMAETDAPFAAPIPHRGKDNEPAYVRYVAEQISELRPEPREEVLTALVSNAKQFYRV